MRLNMLTTLERCAWQELCNSWYFENVMPLRVNWTKHTVLQVIGTKNTFQTICAFLALLFATIFASIPLYSFHLRSGSMNSASFARLPRIRRKMWMMDFYKNFEIWERTSTTFLVYDCGFTSSKRHFYFLLFSSVLCNLLIMSLLEKCMRSSSSCSN